MAGARSAFTMLLIIVVGFALLAPAVSPAAAPRPFDPVERARAATRDALPPGVELSPLAVIQSLAHTIVRFEPSYQGIPFSPARIDVIFDSAGRVVKVNDGLAAANVGAGPCAIDAEQATSSGASLLVHAGLEPFTAPTVRRILYDDPTGAIPAWEVVLVSAEPFQKLRAFVSCDGPILASYDELYRQGIAAKGMVFPENPIVASKDPSFRDNPAGLGLGVDETRIAVDLLGLEADESGFVPLAGPYVRIAEATNLARQPADNANFDYTRADPRFEEVMAYYYIDWAQRHIQELGFDNVRNSTITVNPRVPGAYTAFYAGPAGEGDVLGNVAEIWFGWHAPLSVQSYTPESTLRTLVPASPGFADAAEDANVILHEYGHAVLDEQAGICCTLEAAALHEAFGDWQAASFLTRFSGGFGDGCMAEWFGSYSNRTTPGDLPCYRDLNNALTMADFDRGDDQHFNGPIWSGGVWKAERIVGAGTMERIVLESNFLLPQQTTYADAAEALLLAERALTGGQHAQVIAAAMVERNILAPDAAAAILAGLPIDLASNAGEGPANATPGAEGLGAMGAIVLAAGAVRRLRR